MPTPSYNPIQSVGSATVPAPSVYDFDVGDVSDSDAGRNEAGKMFKNMIGSCAKLELSWNNVSLSDGATILSAFKNEYFSMTFFDGVTGDYRTASFYRGDISAKMYSKRLGIWSSISFNCIERTPHDYT